MWSEHAANRPRVRGSVSVAADMAVHRANIQAGPTTNAVQNFTLFGVFQQLAAPIVDEYNVKFFGPIHLARATRTADERAVGSDGLSRTGGREHGPKQGKVFEPGHYFFDAGDDDVNAGNAGTQTAIALVRRYGNHAGIRHDKIGA